VQRRLQRLAYSRWPDVNASSNYASSVGWRYSGQLRPTRAMQVPSDRVSAAQPTGTERLSSRGDFLGQQTRQISQVLECEIGFRQRKEALEDWHSEECNSRRS